MINSITMGPVKLEEHKHNQAIDPDTVFRLEVHNEWNHLTYTSSSGADRTIQMVVSMSKSNAQDLYRMLGLLLDSPMDHHR